MIDFQIKRTSRRCHATERELKGGESFYSDLVREDDEVVRRDFCEEAWQGPDENSIGWWKSRIPKLEAGRVYWAPRDILVAYFESLCESSAIDDTSASNESTESKKENESDPDTSIKRASHDRALAYVMALLMIRKRIFQLIDTQQTESGELLEVSYSKENKTWMVPVIQLESSAAAEIQQELAQQLFTDQPPE